MSSRHDDNNYMFKLLSFVFFAYIESLQLFCHIYSISSYTCELTLRYGSRASSVKVCTVLQSLVVSQGFSAVIQDTMFYAVV